MFCQMRPALPIQCDHKRVSIIQIGTGTPDNPFLRFREEEEGRHTEIEISEIQKIVQQSESIKTH